MCVEAEEIVSEMRLVLKTWLFYEAKSAYFQSTKCLRFASCRRSAFTRRFVSPAPPKAPTAKYQDMKVLNRNYRYSDSSLAIAVLAVWAAALADRIGVSASACFESMGVSETVLNNYACGKVYSHTCPLCMEDFDGEGAELASCVLDNEICYDGVCGIIVTSAVWKAALSLSLQSMRVQFTSGLQGSLQVGISLDPRSGSHCFLKVNDVNCASCVMKNCGDPNYPDLMGAYADCTSLGQGIYDGCDAENQGSPGDMLTFLKLPDTCGSGGEAGASTTGSDAAPAATPAVMEATQPTSGATANSCAMWMTAIGVLFSIVTVSA